jgi:hypothetical protein
MKKPIPLFTGREAARALAITQPRFARAVLQGVVVPDFVSNNVDLFLPATVKRIAKKNPLCPR